MGKIVRYEFDPENPPPLTADQVAELEALKAMPEDQIDFSDIPPLDDRFFDNALTVDQVKALKAELRARRTAAE